MTGFQEIRRSAAANIAGRGALRILESLSVEARAETRRRLWAQRTYLVVTSGPDLVRVALVGFPADVRALCASALLRRFDDRAGGGFWPETNDIWLAAGVETYESHAQVFRSARHELFHYVCWNHPFYVAELRRGFPGMIGALEAARPVTAERPRYASWVRGFLTQGDHANPIEYFADIPTNFRDSRDLPPSLAAYFGALIDGAPLPPEVGGGTIDKELAAFQQLVAPA